MAASTIDIGVSDIRELWKPKQYKYRLIAFIDILGWKETVNNDKVDRLFTVLENLKEKILEETLLERHLAETKSKSSDPKKLAEARLFVQKQDRQITLFSDSVIISYGGDKDNLEWSFHELIASIFQLHQKLLSDGYLIRGAITYGKLYHKQEKCFGPALVRAIGLEACYAIHPRIIFDKRITRRTKLLKLFYPKNQEIVIKYNDNYFGIDQFSAIKSMIKVLREPNRGSLDESLRAAFYHYRNVIEVGIKSKSISHYLKYYWLLNTYSKYYAEASNSIKLESSWTGTLIIPFPKKNIGRFFKFIAYRFNQYFVKKYTRKLYGVKIE